MITRQMISQVAYISEFYSVFKIYLLGDKAARKKREIIAYILDQDVSSSVSLYENGDLRTELVLCLDRHFFPNYGKLTFQNSVIHAWTSSLKR